MGMLTVNGLDVIRGSLTFPRIGRWTVEAKLDSVDEVTGAVSLVIEDTAAYAGTVMQGGEFAALAAVNIVAGANGLGKLARPRHYVSTRAGTILGDLLRDAGESLSPTSDQSVLNQTLPAWSTAAIPTGRLVKRLLTTLGGNLAWRTLADGSFWFGTETWPDSGLTTDDVDVIEQDDEQGFTVLAMDLPRLLPGTLLFGRRVSYVVYDVTNVLRAKVWYEDSTATTDRLKSAVDKAVLGSVPDVDYAAHYLATVVSQSGTTVDVQPDDPRLPSMASVPLLTGLPQTTVNGTAGGRVLVGWSGRDPSRPFAMAFDSGTSVQTTVIGVLAQLFLGAQAGAEPLIKGPSFLGALGTLLAALGTYTAAIKPTADPSGAATATFAAALTAFASAAPGTLAQKVSVA